MKVSIVVNNYNYAGFLNQSIGSALGQTHNDVEVVVVDDCSTDESPDVIKSYGNDIVAVLNQENRGQGAAFNSGFINSTGDLVMFLDADDYLYPDAVSLLLASWKPGVAMLQGALDLVDVEGRRTGQFPSDVKWLDRGELQATVLRRGRIEVAVTSGLAFSRAVLSQIMPIPEAGFSRGADGYVATLAPLHGAVAVCETPIGVYRQHTNSHSQFSKQVAGRARWQIDHDEHRHAAIRSVASSLGLFPAPQMSLADDQHLGARLASLRLERESHPVPGDQPIRLATLGAKAAFGGRGSFSQRLSVSLWFLAAGLLPIQLARPVIEWRLLPSTRPKSIASLARRVRGLMGRSVSAV
jgi:cellulose synthase/poly-beta-1,6-N-acetylglucosamine synthase-like glycosyltransferase